MVDGARVSKTASAGSQRDDMDDLHMGGAVLA